MNKFSRKMITKAHWSKCTAFWGRRWQIKNENAHTKVSNYMIKCRRNIQAKKWKFNMAGLLREITWPARAARDLRASGNFVKSQNKAGKNKKRQNFKDIDVYRPVHAPIHAAQLRMETGEVWTCGCGCRVHKHTPRPRAPESGSRDGVGGSQARRVPRVRIW